jgi:hypothetical protein
MLSDVLLTVMVYVAFAPEFTELGPTLLMETSGVPAACDGVTALDGADSALFPTALVA